MTPKRESISKKENKSPYPKSSNRKSLLKLQKDEKHHIIMPIKDTTIEIENTSNIDKKRKSYRKSVAFNGKISWNLLYLLFYI